MARNNQTLVAKVEGLQEQAVAEAEQHENAAGRITAQIGELQQEREQHTVAARKARGIANGLGSLTGAGK